MRPLTQDLSIFNKFSFENPPVASDIMVSYLRIPQTLRCRQILRNAWLAYYVAVLSSS